MPHEVPKLQYILDVLGMSHQACQSIRARTLGENHIGVLSTPRVSFPVAAGVPKLGAEPQFSRGGH